MIYELSNPIEMKNIYSIIENLFPFNLNIYYNHLNDKFIITKDKLFCSTLKEVIYDPNDFKIELTFNLFETCERFYFDSINGTE